MSDTPVIYHTRLYDGRSIFTSSIEYFSPHYAADAHRTKVRRALYESETNRLPVVTL
jgi:hypothetical protein